MIVAVSKKQAPGAADTTRRADRDARVVLCRVLRRGTSGQCTGEAVDPNGELLICSRHLARAIELLRAAGLTGVLQ